MLPLWASGGAVQLLGCHTYTRRCCCCLGITLPLPALPCPPPAGAGYLPLLPSFRRLVPVRPVTLTASVTVTVPLLRDIVLWLGVRVVSRRTFEHTLRERRAVLICPGGQAEMCLTQRLHRHKQFTVYSGHKGERGSVGGLRQRSPAAVCSLCCVLRLLLPVLHSTHSPSAAPTMAAPALPLPLLQGLCASRCSRAPPWCRCWRWGRLTACTT